MAFIQDSNPSDIQIKSYEPGVLTLNQGIYHQSLRVSSNKLEPIKALDFKELSLEDLQGCLDWKPHIVLLGTGVNCHIPSQAYMAFFLEHHIGFEFMDTLAACRTFTALTSEERNVVALLLIDHPLSP